MIKIEKVENNIDLITLKNDELEVVVSNYGCTLVKVLMKDQVGNVDDVVLGYDDFKSYQTLDAYIGALVGRVANRIKKGTFELNGQTYHYQLIMDLTPYMEESKAFLIKYLIIKCLMKQVLNSIMFLKMGKKDILVS